MRFNYSSSAIRTAISRGGFVSKSSYNISSTSVIATAHCHPFLLSSFTFHQNRHFSAKPRLDFGRIRDPDDAIALFHEMVRMRQRPSVVDFTKLLSAVVKMKHFSIALVLFDKMLQRNAPVNDYTLTLAIDCFCRLNRVDFGFAILGSFFKQGIEPTVVTITNLIKGLFLEGEAAEAGKLFEKLLREKLCEPNEVTYLTVINGLCKAGHTHKALDLLIYPRNPPNKTNTLTAQGRTDPNQNTGISIHNCRVTAAPDLKTVQSSVRTYLGRPWQKYSRTVFMKTFLDSLIDPAGWMPWSGNFALDTLYYGEYANTGPGSSTANRVNWKRYHVITSESEAAKFTPGSFIAANSWLPQTNVPFTSGL